MNAPFNPVDFIHRLEREGIARGAAEAIAQGIEDRNRELATRQDIDRLSGEIAAMATKAELKSEIQLAQSRQTVQLGAMVAAVVGLATAILGVIIALH